MRLPKGLTLALLLIAVLFFIPAPVFAEQDLPDADSSALFTDFIEIDRDEHLGVIADSIDLPHLPQTAAKRMARVDVEEIIKKAKAMAKGQTIIIDLFDDETLTAKIDRVKTVNQVDSVRAQVEDSFFGFLILSAYDDKALIVIELPDQNKQYKVVYNHLLESHYLYEYNLDEIDELMPAPPLIPPDTTEIVNEIVHEEIHIPETEHPSRERPQRSEEEFPATSTADVMAMTEPTESERAEREKAADQSIAEIDIMIVYTPAACQWATDNATSIMHVMNQAMERAQLSMDNSFLDQDHTLMNMNLVRSGEIDYTESGNIYTDLYRLINGIQGFDLAHQWRDQFGADLVALFSIQHQFGGVAALLDDPAGSPDYGFSITRVQQAHNTLTHIHELGHNMGAHHHKAQNVEPGPGLFDYSAGWRWMLIDDTRLCSIMTYQSGDYFDDGNDHTRIAFFSNPNLFIEGVRAGHSEHGDNTRTLKEVRHVIAGYRPAVEGPDLVIQSLTVEPPSSALGMWLTATVVIKNKGSTNIMEYFHLDFYEHNSGPPMPLEIGNASAGVDGLAAGATKTFSFDFMPDSEGSFQAWAQVDTDMIASNNPHVYGPVHYYIGVAEDIDLVIQSLSVEPSSSLLGTELTATVVIKNEGFEHAYSSFWIEFYDHKDSAPDPGEYSNYYINCPGIAAGATETFSFDFTPLTAGSFQAWAQVDSDFFYSDDPHIYGPVSYTVVDPTACFVTTPNQPSGPLDGFVNETYTYSTGGSGCNCMSKVSYRFIWLDPHHTTHYSEWSEMTSADIYFSLPGTYLITAQARCEKSQTESDYAPVIEIEIEEEEPFVDIVIESLTVEPSPSALGTELTATIVLKNEGNNDSGSFWLDFYVDSDSAPGQGSIGDIYESIADMAPDETRTETFTFTPSATGSYQAWAQAQTVQTISGDHPVYGPVPYVVEAINEHSIYNITFDPPHPATLEFGDRVYFDFDYTSTNSEEVQIRGIPMTGGSNTQNFHSIYINLPTGTGSGSGSFRILDAGQTEAQEIDQVRFVMHCKDTFDLLCETFVEVDYTYSPAEDPQPVVNADNSSATFTDNKDRTGTMTLTVHDQFDDPMPGFGMDDIAVIIGEDFEATLETMNNFDYQTIDLTYSDGVYTATFTLDPGYSQPGTIWDIKVDGVVIEEDMFVSITYEEEPDIDLVVQSLTVEPNASELGTELTATIVIKNQGSDDASKSFWIEFYDHKDSAPNPGDLSNDFSSCPGLAAGDTETFYFNFTPTSKGSYQAWAQVDSNFVYSNNPHIYGPVPYYVEEEELPTVNADNSSATFTDNEDGTGTMILTVHDQFDDPMPGFGMDDIELSPAGANYWVTLTELESFGVPITLIDNNDGTYDITFDPGEDAIPVQEIWDIKVDGVVIEEDMFVSITYEEEPDIDLVVQSLTVEPNTSELGTELTATIVIKNQGSDDVTATFYLDFYKNLENPPEIEQPGSRYWPVYGLNAGETKTYTHTYTPDSEGTYTAWTQVDTDMDVTDNPHVFGPVEYIVEEKPLPVHLIENIVFDPSSPATLEFGEWVYSSFDYTTTNPANVRITGLPMTQGSYTPNHGYLYAEDLPPGTGSDSARFIVNDEGQTEAQLVDQVRFVMLCDDTDQLLYEVIVDVNYTFEPIPLIEHTLTIAIDGQGSTVPAEGTHTYEEGEEVTVTATPAEGWQFVQWAGDASGTNPEITVTMDNHKSVTAVFEEIPAVEYIVIATANPSEGGTVEGGGTYEHGEEVTVTATANPDYEFVNWTEDGTEVHDQTAYTFTAEADRDLVANFSAVTSGQIDAVVLEVEAGVEYVEADLISWGIAYFIGPGDPLYDYVGGGPIVGILSGIKYVDIISYATQYFIHNGDVAQALTAADELDQSIVEKIVPYEP